jgi:glutaminase
MTTAGRYETSGDWLDDVGLPGKSGVGYEAGNSVKGRLAARFLSGRLGLDLFASRPDE